MTSDLQAQVNYLLHQAQPQAAVSLLDQAIATQPQDWQLWNERSVILEQMGELDQALNGYEQVLQTHRNQAEIWYNRGNVLLKLQDLPGAIASYDQALSLQPDLVDALNNRAIGFEQMGDLKSAIAALEPALQLHPHKPEFHFNRGVWLAQLGELASGLTSLEQALAIRPGYGAAWHWRANILAQQNLDQESIKCYRQALAIDPYNPEIANDLGILLEKVGDYDQARQAYEQAIALHPDFSGAWFNLGNVWQKLDCHLEAIKCYEQALHLEPKFAPAHCNLGVSFEREQRLEKAVECFKSALQYCPDFTEAQRNLKSTYQKLVPRWHFVMLNDRDRNLKYEQALTQVITPESVVLDIGAGSGLLAMIAARAGAKQVITCEMVPVIAEIATEIIAANGLSDRIRVIAKKSTNLELGVDLPEPANLLVTETFDVGLLGEEALISIRHAIDHLLTANAQILPRQAQVYAQLIESEQLHQEDFVTSANGFDVSKFNRFALSPNYLQRQLHQYQHQALSGAQPVFTFDFSQSHQPREVEISFPIKQSGTIHAIAFWFDLWLAEQICISTAPDHQYTHWQQAIQILETPVLAEAGTTVQFLASHNCTHIEFSLIDCESQKEF
ncbi:MAG: tetratricopeptide repeat protein [Pseudanabaenaceae cyanobacterium bins.68]|nr:tetratricopeptide repeat protein [Pseudanabaenaceae cyanobacterium bins.68]